MIRPNNKYKIKTYKGKKKHYNVNEPSTIKNVHEQRYFLSDKLF